MGIAHHDVGGPRLETPRLLLRRWTARDVSPMADFQADPEVMCWIGTGTTRTTEETRTAIARWEEDWKTRGFGLFAVEMRETGALAGFTGLAVPTFLPEIMPAVEIGWRLGRPFWGRGIATEAATAVLRFALQDVGMRKVVSIAQVGNTASERVMQKLGLALDRETFDPSCGRPVRVYAIARELF